MEEAQGHTFIVNTQDNNGETHSGEETGIEISIVNHGTVANIVDSSGNPISSQEDDVIAVLGQLFEGTEDTLQHIAHQIVSKPPGQELEDLKPATVNSDRNRPFMCECGKTYTCKSHLKYHQKVHTNLRPYICEICDQTFLQLGHLKRHLRIHTKDKPFACDLCEKTFRQNSHLTCHRRIHTDEKPYSCQVCGMGFRQKTAVFRHVSRRHVKERDYMCTICNRGYSGEADLRRHEKTHVNIFYFAVLNLQTNTSQICGHIQEDMNLTDEEPLTSQENKENNEVEEQVEVITSVNKSCPLPPVTISAARPFKCIICGKTYKSKGHLKFHSKVHLSDRPFKCPFCSKGFLQKGHLRRHVLVHTEEKPYVCTVCNKVFRQVSHLNDHKKIHDNLRPNVCYVCGQGFRQTSALKRHMIRMHATRKAYGCKNCDKKYRLESDLKRHQATACGKNKTKRKPRTCRRQIDKGKHDNESGIQSEELRIQRVNREASSSGATPGEMLTRSGNKRPPYRYRCDVCNKPCCSQTQVKMHMRTHTNERPFQCGVCHKAFKLLAHLKDHMLIHTGERPFSCDICKSKFRRDSALKRHALRMHSKEKKHVCSICKKAYASAIDMRRHRDKHIQDHEGLSKSCSHKKQKKQKRRKARSPSGGQPLDNGNKEGDAVNEDPEGMQVQHVTGVEPEGSLAPAKDDGQSVQVQDTGAEATKDGNTEGVAVIEPAEGMQLRETSAEVGEPSEEGDLLELQHAITKSVEDGNEEDAIVGVHVLVHCESSLSNEEVQ